MPLGEHSARAAVASVCDPELPGLTLEDLGVLRSVEVDAAGAVLVLLTPTYSGCPALDAMREDVLKALRAAGFPRAKVEFTLTPPWSTSMLGPRARERMRALGIAPPGVGSTPISITLKCPNCGSLRTEETSRFGTTSCKSLWRCRSCGEPFEHFKALH
ncbi:MAG: phenylacetate-CoA oxygenase subunit PaaJ [Candidatus Dormibacteraeota bacterium]|jgi:ring-1,2-phenylacetyl-CoA epoxidase subunit PaaD|nr:phenylacetate-CoA oxygenase subunit PaaJ [Candidatus Dormibacteraeota bacterium]